MSKTNLKSVFVLLFAFLLLFTSVSFAEDINNEEIMLISENSEQKSVDSQSKNSDLYISENQYSIKNIIEGNVFASVQNLDIDPSNNGGVITGNLFATANTVTIKSNTKYSETEKDELGNAKLESVSSSSKIDGNVFVTANKFILDPTCEINGDLYICANEIILSQNAVITGNVFAVGNKLSLNSKIETGSLYATVKNFDMQYYGFIFRDLHVSSETATIAGIVYRNSFISANTLATSSTFSNKGDFNVNSASEVSFSGEVKGNANINSKNLTFNSKDSNGKSVNCKIYGNLNYSSNKEMQIEDKIILGSINYSEYKEEKSNNFLSSLWSYLVKLITSLVYVILIYLFITKFMPKYIDKLSFSKMFSSIGIGLGILILVPILVILLLITRIGALVGLLLAILYILMLIIAKPIFIISIANLIKNKKFNNVKGGILVAAITVILSLIGLIPFVGFIISLLVMLCGLGIFFKSLKNR